jgi:hypothetical protein
MFNLLYQSLDRNGISAFWIGSGFVPLRGTEWVLSYLHPQAALASLA